MDSNTSDRMHSYAITRFELGNEFSHETLREKKRRLSDDDKNHVSHLSQSTGTDVKIILSHVKSPIFTTSLTLSAHRRTPQKMFLTVSPKRKLLDFYEFSTPPKIVGYGASSTVYHAKHRETGSDVAVKVITKSISLAWSFGRRHGQYEEYEILSILKNSHPTIINLIDTFESENELYLVMEYCAGGELYDFVRKGKHHVTKEHSTADDKMTSDNQISEGQIATIISQLLSALKFLHNIGVVHGDIKLENILFLNQDENDLRVKLADFGLAERMKKTLSEDSKDFSANSCLPEAFSSSREYFPTAMDTVVDVYSVGRCLFILLLGFDPIPHWSTIFGPGNEPNFTTLPIYADLDMNKKNDLVTRATTGPQCAWDNISHDGKDLLMKMLHPNPKHRVSASEALDHKWIQKHVSHKLAAYDTSSHIVDSNSTKHVSSSNSKKVFKKIRRNSLLSTSSVVLSTQVVV